MADLALTASLTDNNNSETFAPAASLAITQAGGNKRFTEGRLTLTTTPGVAIPVPGGTLGWACFQNMDSAIVITLTPATGGTATISLAAGEFALFRYASTVSAPFAFSASGTPILRYRVHEA